MTTDTPLRKQPTLWDQSGDAYQYSAASRAFWAFHVEYPQVYDELVKRCQRMRARGLRFGIRTLWEAMRWDFAVVNPPEPYRLNDHYTSFYARMIMDQEPDLADIFETRRR